MTRKECFDSLYPKKVNEIFEYMNANPDEFNSSNDEKPQPDDDKETVENGTPPAVDEENEENFARRDPCAKEPDSGDSLDESTLNYSEDNNDKKFADKSLDDGRKPAAK